MIKKLNLNECKKEMLSIAYENNWGHIASSLTALPIMVDIYNKQGEGDIFILSKGHAAMGLYSILTKLGNKPNMQFSHPVLDVANGVYATTGSLGHGLPFSCGIAYAKKLLGEEGIIDVLMGDGECQEGTTWESMHLIKRLNLTNLQIHVDCNLYQANEPDLYLGFPVAELFNYLGKQVDIHVSTKGDGLKLFKGNPLWHVHYLSKDEYKQVMGELDG
jgi:transketolase